MSKCISRHGEYSEHTLGTGVTRFVCLRCFVFDENDALTEIERLTAELALKDQALDEIKALHFETPCLCGPFGLPSGHPSCAACADDGWPCETLRVLTRLDTQGETK